MEHTTIVQITPPSEQIAQNQVPPSSTCSSLLHFTLSNMSHEKTSRNLSSSSGELPSSDSGVHSRNQHWKKMQAVGNKFSSELNLEETGSTRTNSHTPPPNPFEIGIEERLHLSSYSPSMFSVTQTPTKSNKPFRWSIDQLAKLDPADIDIMASLEQCSFRYDQEKEKKAQEAINTFFSQPHIAPSPWLQPNQTPAREYMPISFSPCMSSTAYLKRSEINGELPIKDACTQTMLTLPVDFDIGKILGEYFTFNWEQVRENESMEEDSKDSLSASSLRRKLFFHEDSPTSNSSSNDDKLPFSGSPSVSPLKQTPVKKLSSPNKSDSIHFSSSPIINLIGRSSTTPPRHFTSPPISPIKTSLRNSPMASSLIQANKSLNSKQNMSSDEMMAHSLRSVLSGGSFTKLYDVSRLENSYMKISVDEKTGTFNTENIASTNDPNFLSNHGDGLRNSNYQFCVSDAEQFTASVAQDTGYQTGSLQMTNSDSIQTSLFQGSNTLGRLSSVCAQNSSFEYKPTTDDHVDNNYAEIQNEFLQKEFRNCTSVQIDYHHMNDNGDYCRTVLPKDEFSDNNVLSCVSWNHLTASTPTKLIYLNDGNR